MFQFKIIHNILPTQSSLFHARITDADVCPFCNLESQSLKRMLITCSVCSSFWTCFSNWWQEKCNQMLTLFESTILYGWHKESNNLEVIMFLQQAYPTASFDSFLLRLNNKIDTLCTIAFRYLTAYRSLKKHWPNFFRYVNGNVISIIHIPLSYAVLLYCFTY